MTLCPHCGQPMPTTTKDELARYFAAFWEAYPHRIGKIAAQKSLERALRTAKFGEIMEGLARYKAAKPAHVPWCNPSTFLNQARHFDQPDYIVPDAKPEPPKQDGFELWRVRIRNYLKDGKWPQIAPPLAHCPPQVRTEFEEQLKAHSYARTVSYEKSSS